MSFYFHKEKIIINSADRQFGNSGDFLINVDSKTGKKYNKISLAQISIPKSYYTITQANTFQLDEGTPQTVSLTTGFYSYRTLITEIETQLNSVGGWAYTVSYSSLTGKFTFSVSGNSGVQPSLILNSSSPFRQIGFTVGTHAFSSDSLESQSVIDLTGPRMMLLKCSAVDSKTQILGEIAVNNADLSNIIYISPDYQGNSKDLIAEFNSSNAMRFWLTDSNDDIIDLNGLDISFSIVLYRQNDSGLIHKKSIVASLLDRLNDEKI